jgi:hypothetical protein
MKEGEIKFKKALINASSTRMVSFYATPVADSLLVATYPIIYFDTTGASFTSSIAKF